MPCCVSTIHEENYVKFHRWWWFFHRKSFSHNGWWFRNDDFISACSVWLQDLVKSFTSLIYWFFVFGDLFKSGILNGYVSKNHNTTNLVMNRFFWRLVPFFLVRSAFIFAHYKNRSLKNFHSQFFLSFRIINQLLTLYYRLWLY